MADSLSGTFGAGKPGRGGGGLGETFLATGTNGSNATHVVLVATRVAPTAADRCGSVTTADEPSDASDEEPGGGKRLKSKEIDVACGSLPNSDERRGRDSNPGYGCPHTGFRDRPNRPLWHLSG